MSWSFHDPYGRRPRWGFILLLGLLIGVAIAAVLNGWLFPSLSLALNATATPFPSPVPAATATVAAVAQATATATVTVTLPPITTGAPAPAFILPDLFDETITHTLNRYQGQPLVLNFWASWCTPCQREMSALQQIADTFAADGLVVLGVNETYLDALNAARRFVIGLGVTFPLARDDHGQVSEQRFRVRGLPTTIFISPEGTIAHVQIGEMTLEEAQTYSRLLLAGEPIPPATPSAP
jgi:peroxiredoxin